MVQEHILKEKLIRIKENDYLLENQEDYYPLGLEMMESIGSLDPELRDKLIYTTMFYWVTKSRFTAEQLKNLLEVSLDSSHLFYKLGQDDEDDVFKRTFSVLIIALVIYVHREENFLTEKALYEVKDKLLEYMNNEKDVRGYVEEKGWAHSAAHTADALDELVQCNPFNEIDLLDVLNSIKAKVCIGYYVYIDEESERLVNAVESALNRKLLGKDEIIEWLGKFEHEVSDRANKVNAIESFHMKVNIKGFLRSLYFRFLEREDSGYVIKGIKRILKNM